MEERETCGQLEGRHEAATPLQGQERRGGQPGAGGGYGDRYNHAPLL